MVITDASTHYVALKPVPHCKAYYAYTKLYEHWIAKFGLPEILFTDNGTEFINNEIITLCHLYNIKHKPRISHGLVEINEPLITRISQMYHKWKRYKIY